MNFYLLQLVGKWISLITISLMSFLGYEITEEDYSITNDNFEKNVPAIAEVVKHDVEKSYNNSLASGITNILSEGKDGLSFVDANGNVIVLSEVENEKVEIGTGKKGVYNGIMTAYGPDCSTCSGRGYVACHTEDKQSFNLIDDGVYYDDTTYGEVRIMAAALSEFPCGTIIKVENSNLGDFIGIVLDTGYDMRKALTNGIYHFDIAFATEKDPDIKKVTNKTGEVIYNVQRWGW